MEHPLPATPDVAHFLDTVQPRGIHYLAYNEGGIKHAVYRAPEEGVSLSGRDYIRRCDTYFALASFKREKKPVAGQSYEMCDRTHSNVDKLRSIWFDVDFKSYSSKNAATMDVVKFLKESGLPKPTWMVATGGGYHLYWAVDRDLETSEWLPLAKALREMMKARGLRADYQVTVDPARIMRLPGTSNYKYPPQVIPCSIMGGAGAQYPYEVLQLALQEFFKEELSGNALGVDATVVQLFGNAGNARELASRPPFRMANTAKGCGVVADSLARQGAGDGYALWKNLLHLASFAEDGVDFIHDLSRLGNGYSPEETQSRYEESLNAAAADPAIGPTLCETFSGLSTKCQTCPFWGKIKTPAAIKFESTEEGIVLAQPDHLDPTFVERGCTFTMVSEVGEEGETTLVRKMILDKELDNWRYGEDNQTPLLQFTYRNKAFESTVELKNYELFDTNAFRAVISKAGVVFFPAQEKALREAMLSWMSRLQQTQQRRSQPAFGWVYNQDTILGFAHNGVLHKPDGTTAISGSVDPIMREIYGQSGDPEVWNEVARNIERDERPAIHMLLASSFGSPLMAMGSDANAFTLCFYSRQSGVGKSSNMMAAQAVWGDPKRAMSSLDDTMASVSQKTGKTTGLPAYWDELAKNRVPEFVQLMFQATQGKTRQRLDQSGKLRETYQMTGFMVSSSNDPVMDDVLAYRDGTAGLYRFFQVQVPPRSESKANFDPNFDAKVSRLYHNFGHAGETYAAFLAQNIPLVQSTMENVRELVAKRMGVNENERFWRHALVCLVSGAMLARMAGLINLDHKAIFDHYMHLVGEGRLSCGAVESEVTDIAAEIFHAYQQNLIIVKNMPAQGKGRGFTTEIYHSPQQGAAIKLQLSVGDGKLVIPHVTVAEFCDRTGRSISHVNSVLTQQLKGTKQKITMAAGTPLASTQARLYACVVDMHAVLSPSEIDRWQTKAGIKQEVEDEEA